MQSVTRNGIHLVTRFRRDVAAVHGVSEMPATFEKRCFRADDKPAEVLRIESSEPLLDLADCGRRGLAQLVAQPEMGVSGISCVRRG
jgi:hypothetical protein